MTQGPDEPTKNEKLPLHFTVPNQAVEAFALPIDLNPNGRIVAA